jgi:membrane protein DedA with SNARE-associated domain
VSLAGEPFDEHRPKDRSWQALIFMMLLLALATFVTEDLTCISAGLLVARGAMGFIPSTIACLLGIFVGDMLLYLAGRWFGPPALKRAPLKWMLKPDQVERGAAFFQQQGPALVFATRFVPGTRLPTYFASGMFRAPFWKFAGWFLLAAAVWTPLLVGLACWIGGHLLAWFERFEKYALLGLGAVVFLLWLILKVAVPMCSHKGRRFLLSSWRRKTRWEFWPMFVFYPPVVIYLLWLAVRYRSLTLFTAANPAIPQGGFVMESKSAILQGLGNVPEVARWHLLPLTEAEAMANRLTTFMATESLTYPIVLKPDIGERGSGVGVIRSEEEALAYLKTAKEPIIAQEYIGGREYGAFYYHYLNESQGKILSITNKRLISVTGDGEKTLESLILDNDRAVCMAPFFMDQLGARVTHVPAKNEIVSLSDVGTHCRGALFLNGNQHITEALRVSIDRVSQGYAGFYFGRYDLRVPSESDLKTGRNLKVLELNGVTSESTDINDPKNGLFSAYRTLFEQWRIAFEIGAQSRERGVTPATISELWHLVRASRSQNVRGFDR